ncbi:MAG: hypothetical protein K2P58_00365 [Hyphomonadaceae bacterium]|nr:hypothetical protein [Hyphomonadaceae bacterium]
MRRNIVVIALAAFAASTPALAQEQPTPPSLERVYECANLSDSAERLACYDTAVAALRTAQTGGQVVAIDRASVENLQRQSFGFDLPAVQRLLPSFGDRAVVESVEATVERITELQSGRLAFRLSNGQVWHQVDTERVRNVREGDTITIRDAALGSFLMVSPRGGRGVRVRRQN